MDSYDKYIEIIGAKYTDKKLIKNKNKKIVQGGIYFVDLGKGEGSEQSGVRPCVVLQNDIGNKCSTTTIIAPITKEIKRNKNGNIQPTHYPIYNFKKIGLKCESTVLLEQIRVVDKVRILDYEPIGFLPYENLIECILISLGINQELLTNQIETKQTA